MDKTPWKDYLGIDLFPRSMKPREQGITMVIDVGYNNAMVESVLKLYGHLIDIVKITELHLTCPLDEIKRKIDLYRSYGVGVQPGGIVIELARLQKREKQVLENLKTLGFDHIEVSSSSTTQRESEIEAEFVRGAMKLGIGVIGEVGKKFHDGDKTRKSDTELNVEETVNEFRALLEGGAKKVYWEGHVPAPDYRRHCRRYRRALSGRHRSGHGSCEASGIEEHHLRGLKHGSLSTAARHSSSG